MFGIAGVAQARARRPCGAKGVMAMNKSCCAYDLGRVDDAGIGAVAGAVVALRTIGLQTEATRLVLEFAATAGL